MKEATMKKTTYHDESVLEIYDLDRGERRVVREFPCLVEAPNWTPDGKHLLYNSGGRLYRLTLATGETVMLDTGFADRCNNDHVLSADGTGLAISHQAAEDNGSRIYTLPLADGIPCGAPRLVTPLAPSYLHGWSPDKKLLAYCACRGGVYNIYTIPAEGGVETQLTDTPGLDDGPEFDAVGGFIWFCSVRSGLMQVWRMRADGSEQTQMTFDTEWNTWFPHISPDGSTVVTLSYRRGDLQPHEHLARKHVQLRLMDANGGNVRTAVSLFGGQGTINVNSWSPDSRRFAFVSYKLVADD